MPVLGRSFVFASNRGGAGKSTLVHQAVSQYAQAHPELKVLVVDMSIHADASALLLGGCREPSEHTQGARTMGMQRVVTSPPERRAAGLLAAATRAGPAPSLAGRFSKLLVGAPPPEEFDVEAHSMNVLERHPESGQPPNLFVAPGGPELSICSELGWKDSARLLRERLESASGEWAVFYDTDAEIMERPSSCVALAAADRIVVPMSASWNDYRRLLDDGVNGLFSALERMEAEGSPVAKIDRVVFNRVSKHANAASELHKARGMERDATLSFSPVKAVLEQLAQISDHCFETGWRDASKAWARHYMDGEKVGDEGQFGERYVGAMFEISENAMQASQLSGVPFCRMSASETYVRGQGSAAGIKVPADALDKIKQDVALLVEGWRA